GARGVGGGGAPGGARAVPGAATLAVPLRAALRWLRLPGLRRRRRAGAQGVRAARVARPRGSRLGGRDRPPSLAALRPAPAGVAALRARRGRAAAGAAPGRHAARRRRRGVPAAVGADE